MRSEDEVRKHLESLQARMRIPCGCAGTVHAAECYLGAKMMKVVAENLKWVLGDESLASHVEVLAAAARNARGDRAPSQGD